MRKINPHKGNRNKNFPGVRCSEETLNQIHKIIASRTTAAKRFTIADWIAEKAAEDATKLEKV